MSTSAIRLSAGKAKGVGGTGVGVEVGGTAGGVFVGCGEAVAVEVAACVGVAGGADAICGARLNAGIRVSASSSATPAVMKSRLVCCPIFTRKPRYGYQSRQPVCFMLPETANSE